MPAMQEVELALIAAAVLTVVVGWAIRTRAHSSARSLGVGAILGIVAGIIGAVVVLVPRTDLIPDGIEPLIWIVIGVVGTAVTVLALTMGWARR